MGLATVTSASIQTAVAAFDLDNVSTASMGSSNLYRSTAMPIDCLIPHAGFGPFTVSEWDLSPEHSLMLPVQPGSITGLDAALDIKSNFFEARLLAEVGDVRARLETVFQRGKDNKLVMLRRLSGGAE